MARNKNALRAHYVAEYDGTSEVPGAEVTWLELARYIETADPDNNEETEELGFYDGDGTPETDVISVAVGYTFTGHYDPEDPAQKFVADKEFAVGDARKIFHKRVSADGLTEWIGKATLSGIVVGGGDATEYEQFGCNIRWDKAPVKSDVVGG